MALNFTNATSDRVIISSPANTNTLANFTILEWVYPTATTDNALFMRKGTLASTGWFLTFSGSTGNIRMRVGRSTATDHTTNSTPLSTTNKWYCVAATYAQSGATGERINIYTGDLTTLVAEATYGSAVDGSGTQADDSAVNIAIGNAPAASPTGAFSGYIAIAALVNRVMTISEIQSWQFNPRVVSGTVLFTHLGFNGTTDTPDWSGNGNDGTITGATVVDHVPLGPPFARYSGWGGAFTTSAPATNRRRAAWI